MSAAHRRRAPAGHLLGLSLVAGLVVGCGEVSTTDPAPDASAAADAAVDASTATATISVSATGAPGAITSSPAGLDCGATCAASFALGQVVTLTASVPPGSAFGGWDGACTGTATTCSITVTDDVAVEAAFELVQHQLTLTVSGSGAVTSTTPAGLVGCGSGTSCTALVDHGTTVELEATTATHGGSFIGWSGACAGTAPSCQVAMDQARMVGARFSP